MVSILSLRYFTLTQIQIGCACYLLHAGFLLDYYSILKMEGTCSSETSVDFQRTTLLYIPETRTLQIQISFLQWLVERGTADISCSLRVLL
jgi:hypothetical protein